MRCAELGNPLRNSDPQIASAVNIAARQGGEITLADPPGLHWAGRSPPAWSRPTAPTRRSSGRSSGGDAEHTLRARFEVPAQKKYVVGDIKIGGRPIRFGGQVADRVQVWIEATVMKGNHKPKPKRCGA